MDYRRETLVKETSLSASDTLLEDLDIQDHLSRLHLRLKVTLGAGNMLKHPSAALKAFEIVDGSEELLSLEGTQLVAINHCATVPTIQNRMVVSQSVDQYFDLIYDFGRYLWDEDYCFNPAHYRNPQIKVEWDGAVVEANDGSGSIQVIGYLFDDLTPSPRGFFSAKELKRYSPTDDGWEYIDLPTDNPYRFLFVQAYDRGVGVSTTIDTIVLNIDGGKSKPLDNDIWELIDMVVGKYGRMTEMFSGKTDQTSNPVALAPSMFQIVGHAYTDEANLVGIGTADGGHLGIEVIAGGADKIAGHYSGALPASCVELLLPQVDNPERYFDPTGIGSMRLEVKAGSAAFSGTTRVFVQQVRGV